MNENIHGALDGELSRERLSAAERQELSAFETAIDASLAGLPDEPSPDVSHAVLWRVREVEPVPAWLPEPLIEPWLRAARASRWLWQPRPVRIRPAFALAACAVLALVPATVQRFQPEPTAVAETARMLVQFRLAAEDAQHVSLVGDFTGWEPKYRLEQVSPGVWSIIVPLEAGVYDYAFVVNGETWRLDPLAPSVADGFGGANSRVAVLEPERTSVL